MILIISEDNDQTMNRVISWLKFFNAPYIRVTKYSDLRLVEININHDLNESYIDLTIDENPIRVNKDSIIYVRRGFLNFLNLSHRNTNIIRKGWLNEESSDIVAFINYFFGRNTKYCLGSFINYRINKLIQLNIAQKAGLLIPNTKIITQQTKNIIKGKEKHITKPVSDIVNEKIGYMIYESGGAFVIEKKELLNNWSFPSFIQN